MKFLFAGDIVGRSGRNALRLHLENNKYDFIVANVENSAAGFGITDKVYNDLKSMKIHAMTAGNHVWDKKEVETCIDKWDMFIRPANISSKACGQGYRIFDACGRKICVINLLGRVFMNISNCPFESFDNIYESHLFIVLSRYFRTTIFIYDRIIFFIFSDDTVFIYIINCIKVAFIKSFIFNFFISY